MTEKTIKLCGKDVPILYCAATETGYERLSGKNIEVFLPTFGKDDDGNVIISEPPKATTEDYLQLSIAAIVAANEAERLAKNMKPDEFPLPITSEDLLYQAAKSEVTSLITAVIELRNEWYGVSTVVKEPTPQEEEDRPKNMKAPTSDT